MKTTLRSITAKAVLLVSSLILALTVVEVGLRIFYTEERKRSVTYDEDLGWGGIPFAEGAYVDKEDSTHARYKFNELGFRDEPISSLSDSSTRIVLLGDSFVESMEVEYDSTFFRRVGHLLKTGVSKCVDVVNVSSQGYGTAQEILAIDKYRSKIRPNVVILVFYTGNDFSDNARKRFATINNEGKLEFNRQKEHWLRRKYSWFMSWLYDNSHLVYYVKNVMQSRLNFSWFSNPAATELVADSKDYERKITELLLLNLRQKMEETETPLGIVIIPQKSEVAGRRPSNPEFVEQVCKTNRIACLNLYGKLEPSDFLNVDTHFTLKGHRVVADLLYAFLVDHFSSFPKSRVTPHR